MESKNARNSKSSAQDCSCNSQNCNCNDAASKNAEHSSAKRKSDCTGSSSSSKKNCK